MKQNTAFLAALATTMAMVSDARTYGSVLAPRGYQFSRRPRDTIDLVSEIFSVPVYMNSLMKQHEAEVSRLAQSNAPRYSVWEDPESGVVELTMELPGVSAKDINIELENDRLLRISGSRKFKRGGTLFESDFDQTFEMHKDVDPDRLKVTLSDGILTVQAPKKEKIVRQITITTADPEDVNVKKLGPAEEEPIPEAKAELVHETVDEDEDEITITEE